nr:MAG TPA: hypothetical protein [Caudoviricetes sp.]
MSVTSVVLTPATSLELPTSLRAVSCCMPPRVSIVWTPPFFFVFIKGVPIRYPPAVQLEFVAWTIESRFHTCPPV